MPKCDDGLDSFPSQAFGPLQQGLHVAQLGSLPMQFQNPPAAFNRVRLAVIGRVIEQLKRLADGIDQLHHPLQKLGTDAAALGPSVHFELDLVDPPLFLTAQPVPPGREGIHEEVTGCGRTPEGHMELGRIFIKNPTREIVFGAAKVMVTGFVVPARLSTPRKRP